MSQQSIEFFPIFLFLMTFILSLLFLGLELYSYTNVWEFLRVLYEPTFEKEWFEGYFLDQIDQTKLLTEVRTCESQDLALISILWQDLRINLFPLRYPLPGRSYPANSQR